MKDIRTIVFSGVVALLSAGVAVFFTVHTPVAYAAECTINATDVAQITAVQNDATLSYSDETKAELALRQKLVGETIGCANQEVQSFEDAINALPALPDSQTLQSQYLGQLSYATNFYNAELAKSNESGVEETKIIAKEVLDWRESTFIPLTNQINNFILWTQNQALFDTAQTRMDQTTRAVAFLEAASPNADLQTALNATAASFNTALSENAQAKTALDQDLSADQSLILIKQSLDSLSSTYQGFSTVSGLIKAILPQ